MQKSRFFPRFFLHLLMLVLLFPTTPYAQPDNETAGNGDTIHIESSELGELISLLEDDSRRSEFINTLKTLQQVHEEQNARDTSLHIAEMVGLEDAARTAIEGYETLVERHRLDSSVLGRLALTLGTLLLALLLIVLVRFARKRAGTAIENLMQRHHITYGRYYTLLRLVAGALLLGILFMLTYTLLVIWDLASFDALTEGSIHTIISTLLNVFLVLLLALLLWEVCNGLIETALHRAGGNARRLQTLLPVARNALLLVFGAIFSLMILSELGIEIMPLLAGAGIVGIAVGFGAQTLVKDFLAGFMVILEDLIRVGDVVNVAGHGGVVERITIRKVDLRDLAGTVHTVPFSEITIIENMTKDFSYYVLDVRVSYREDPDEVIALLREIDEEMRKEAEFGPNMLEPLDVLGVDNLEDNAVVIKVRLKTLPIKQWLVGREFNRRMKKRFAERNIEIPFPQRTLHFGQNKDGSPTSVIPLAQRETEAAS